VQTFVETHLKRRLCYQQVASFERAHSLAFDWIVVMRPDVWFFGSMPTHCSLVPGRISFPVGGALRALGTVPSPASRDLVPRFAAVLWHACRRRRLPRADALHAVQQRPRRLRAAPPRRRILLGAAGKGATLTLDPWCMRVVTCCDAVSCRMP